MLGDHVFPPKRVPTEVKHLILESYLKAWGGIIISSNQQSHVRLAFVDTCCGSGVYQPSPDETEPEHAFEPGSAIIGLKELLALGDYATGKVKSIRTKALLINKSVGELETLKSAIADAIPSPPTHEILHGRFDENGDRVFAFCTDWFSFVFIDPYGPTPTPFNVVSRVVGQRYTDALINFPYLTLQKWSGWIGRRLNQDQTRKLAAADAFFGSSEWQGIAVAARDAGKGLDEVLLEHYMAKLDNLRVYVTALPLLFEDKARIIYHLVFTSHNIAGLSAMKGAFQKADRHQAYLRVRRAIGRENKVKEQLTFGFDVGGAPAGADAVDAAQLADDLHREFKGQQVLLERVILRGLREPSVLEGDVRKALTALKREHRVAYDDTTYKTPVRFS